VKKARYLQKNSRPVAGIRFAPAGATVFQILENLDRLLENPPGLATLDVDDKAQPHESCSCCGS
jgi:hypothetical protein